MKKFDECRAEFLIAVIDDPWSSFDKCVSQIKHFGKLTAKQKRKLHTIYQTIRNVAKKYLAIKVK